MCFLFSSCTEYLSLLLYSGLPLTWGGSPSVWKTDCLIEKQNHLEYYLTAYLGTVTQPKWHIKSTPDKHNHHLCFLHCSMLHLVTPKGSVLHDLHIWLSLHNDSWGRQCLLYKQGNQCKQKYFPVNTKISECLHHSYHNMTFLTDKGHRVKSGQME